MSDKLIEHKLMKYQFYAVLILVSVFYIWWSDDVQSIFKPIPWIKWLPLIGLAMSGVTYLFAAHRVKSEIHLVEALTRTHSTILKENDEVNYMDVTEQGSGTFSILVTYKNGLKEEFKVNRKKILSRLKV